MELSRDKIFWYTVSYIREYNRPYEIRFGTSGLFRAARELVKHFEYAEKRKGQEWVLENFCKHIGEYITEQEEMANASENHLREDQEHGGVRDQ